MDFYKIKWRKKKKGVYEIYPDFKICRSKDLMVRGGSFYAIWDAEKNIWSTDEYDVQRLVDKDLNEFAKNFTDGHEDDDVQIMYMSDFSSKSWQNFKTYLKQVSDNSHQLDNKLIFSNADIRKEDYASRKLDYPLKKGDYKAYDELIGTLYEPEEREKIEWGIGSIVAGDSKDIQKFIVLYGEAGAGKSTILNIIQELFKGYYAAFEARELASSNNSFSTEAFKSNPLVAIQHDGDLSKIEDNTKLNSIISHEEMRVNEKYKTSYTMKFNAFLFMATNRPVKITDAKSGIIRRLIDVRPSGNHIPIEHYQMLVNQIPFELGAIAQHCLDVYLKLGKNYYNGYRPINMILKTDFFYNFVEENFYIFKEEDSTTLRAAYEMYKQYCDDSSVTYKLPRYKFKEELKNYFKGFTDRKRIDDKFVRSYYYGFEVEKFMDKVKEENDHPYSLDLDSNESIFDELYADCPAQYASKAGTPMKKWENVKTKLKDIDTTKLHYVKVPENHIVIDFDLKGDDGEKSLEKNLEAASKWPHTYSELSKSGAGIHLHYIYDGDASQLSRIYDDNIEVKVFTGNSSLRRKLTKCNDAKIAKISSGLKMKGASKVVDFKAIDNEKGIRTRIKKCLNKEHHGATKPEVDFIFATLEDAYKNGIKYDVTDLRPKILAFANNSSHQALKCISMVNEMHFCSDEPSDSVEAKSDKIVFFDVEVFPNLFVIVWKFKDGDPVKMINPNSKDVEDLLKYKLIGFNNRRYDNHILYARLVGYSNEELFTLSQRMVNGSKNAMFREAYNLSYADIYDFSSKKQSLKKFEIELGIHHQELGLRWDEPVEEKLWPLVADYCVNDVVATEAVFEARQDDFIAREVLADLSGLTVNDTTQSHTAKIIFGDDRHPQEKFVYTDLSKQFKGYSFDHGVSTYRGENPGEGGYVYSEPGMYGNVALLDIASMHPNSLINLNLFGPYTDNFKQLLDARIAIKHKDYDKAKSMLNGVFKPYLKSEKQSKTLAYALKIVINSVYGLTSAKFDNKFKDPRNIDNIVAKRGALFMIDLKHEVQKKGFTVAHIKTDSIKIPDATPEIIDFVIEFGKKYGYSFEHEATYDKMCLVNDSVYIAKVKEADGEKVNYWSATGAQFQHPYVFKQLFSHEKIKFEDMCETKTVTSALYLDMNEDLGDDEHSYRFVGKAGSFCPIEPSRGGGLLMREKDGKYYAATGTKGYRWLEAEEVKEKKKQKDIDKTYFQVLVDEAIRSIEKYGDFEWFVADEEYQGELKGAK